MQNDKRFFKNEQFIISSFLLLLKEKCYSEITINELCEKAFISKNTFYAHFENKDALLKKIIRQLAYNVMPYMIIADETNNSEKLQYDNLNGMVEYFDSNFDTMHTLFKRDEEIHFTDLIYKEWKDQTINYYNVNVNTDIDVLVLLDYSYYGVLHALKYWINNSKYISKEELKQLIMPLHSIIGKTLMDHLIKK